MPKQITRPKVHYLKPVYADYAQKLLEKHPDWWGKYCKKIKMKNCYIYARGRDGKPVLKMSWFMWKEIVSSFFYKAKDAIIQGETLRMGSNLGKIRAIRVERNFSKPAVDWGTTFREGIRGEDGKLKRVYFTAEDYCRIAWRKFGMIPNETSYSFDPATRNMATNKGMKYEFSQALMENPLLKFRYKYYPIIRKKKEPQPCNTATAQ